MRLVWARFALDDRDTIFTYIENENPTAAVGRRVDAVQGGGFTTAWRCRSEPGSGTRSVSATTLRVYKRKHQLNRHSRQFALGGGLSGSDRCGSRLRLLIFRAQPVS